MTRRVPYVVAIERVELAEHLRGMEWAVAGTPPLGIDVEGSDIDILCRMSQAESFAELLWSTFSGFDGFSVWQWAGEGRNVVARFEAEGWTFEIFGDMQPLESQAGWRHFMAESRLLEIGGPRFRDAIMALRRKGVKTEPAFADVLRRSGDPYAAILDLHDCNDDELRQLMISAGFVPA